MFAEKKTKIFKKEIGIRLASQINKGLISNKQIPLGCYFDMFPWRKAPTHSLRILAPSDFKGKITALKDTYPRPSHLEDLEAGWNNENTVTGMTKEEFTAGSKSKWAK